MIGLALHLGQRALDGLVDRLLPLPVSLALGLCRETNEVERLGAECDQLRDERDRARASLRELGGLLTGIAHRMTDDEAELALAEMAAAGARLARAEAAAKALVELRAAASKAIARTQLFTEGKCSEEDAKAATLALIKLCLPPEAPHG